MMKRIALGALLALGLAAPASAADMRMPVKAPPPIVAPIFTWTGFYLGGHLGAGWTSHGIREEVFGVEKDSIDRIEIVPTATGSSVTYDADLRLRGPWRAFSPLMAIGFRRIGERAADGLTTALEGERA